MKPVDSSLYCPRLGQSGVFLVKTAPMTMLDRLAKASPDGPRRTYWASRSERELTGQTACPLCGGDASCAILEAKGFREGNTTTPGDYVVERAFVDG